MFGLKIISKREYEFLLEEVKKANLRIAGERERAKERVAQFEKLFIVERERADRLLDQVISLSGNEPVSERYQTEQKAAVGEYESRMAEMEEIYNDQLGEIFGASKDAGPAGTTSEPAPTGKILDAAEQLLAKVESSVQPARS